MIETKAFPTVDVISAVSGVLVSGIGGVYEVLGWMAGESLFTHQLPRVGEEARPVAIAFDPRIAIVLGEAKQVTPDNWQEWRDRWVERLGPELSVPRLDATQHRRVHPLTELREMIPDTPVVVVSKDDAHG
ncbi:DUF7736 domain-containing protein [Xanthobacter aminoxidans]|uniref:DUF7736 domain-containing protein n=1 Tax=Xanthobacter aminoxidans TaxID=186280 RepID=UPI002022FDD1|nr:hypothetical protein [Xanthobacter aminoxidans]MCL8382112.1 hypothetical protein [Xanthobacter aminoxidans]